MFNWLKDFFVSKQTFISAMGDAAGIIGIVAASPEVQAYLVTANPLVSMAFAGLAYLGGVISGRRTNMDMRDN